MAERHINCVSMETHAGKIAEKNDMRAQRDQAVKDAQAMLELLRDLVDPDDCYFDHHGGCQAHGYLSLEPGEKCPHAEAKELLSKWAVMR